MATSYAVLEAIYVLSVPLQCHPQDLGFWEDQVRAAPIIYRVVISRRLYVIGDHSEVRVECLRQEIRPSNAMRCGPQLQTRPPIFNLCLASNHLSSHQLYSPLSYTLSWPETLWTT